MLKLMKYEITHSKRTFMTSFLVYLIGCALLPFAMHFLGGHHLGEMILGIILFIFIVLIMGITLALFISIFINYNRSMFERPGYLTLTLPKSNLEILISKLMVALIWVIVGIVVLFLGIIILFGIVLIMEGNQKVGGFFEFIRALIAFIPQNLIYYLTTFIQFLVELGLVISTIYFSITITHTKWFRKYKMPLAIVIFFVLNILISTLLDNAHVGHVLSIGIVNNSSDPTNMGQLGVSLFNALTIGINFILCSLFIFLTTYILDRHIEVE